MPGYNPYTDNVNSKLATQEPKNKGFFSRILRNLSSLGQDYDDMIVRNTIGVNINEDPNQMYAGDYDMFSRKAVALMANNATLAYMIPRYKDKKNILREYAIKDEISGFVTKLCNEAISYEDDRYFCKLKDLDLKYDQRLKDNVQKIFKEIYSIFGLGDHQKGWDLFRQFIIDGFLSFEIVYDDKQKNIIYFNQLDASDIIYALNPVDNTKVWIQYPEDPSKMRMIPDSNMIYISYSNSIDYAETSYIEPLIRPYNMLQLLQYTKINFNLLNAMIHKLFIIPVGDMGIDEQEQQIGTLIADYHDEVVWDDYMGKITIDGRQHLPLSKEYWLPENGGSKPDVSFLDQKGHDINESDMLIWFYNILKRASKIPFGRFDLTNGGGNIYGEFSEASHDENDFTKFIDRLRGLFIDILLKPIWIQSCLNFPELQDNKEFKNDLNILFNGNNEIERSKKLKNLETCANIASTLQNNLKRNEETPYLHIEYIMREVMGFTDEQLALNNKYFETDASGTGAAGEGGTDSGLGEGSNDTNIAPNDFSDTTDITNTEDTTIDNTTEENPIEDTTDTEIPEQ